MGVLGDRGEGTVSRSWGELGTGENAWLCPPAALGATESKLRTCLREQASSIGCRSQEVILQLYPGWAGLSSASGQPCRWKDCKAGGVAEMIEKAGNSEVREVTSLG